jgi:hypothetical protein
MDDNMPDMPLENFGGSTEVATPPVAPEATPVVEEQTTQIQPQANGSDGEQAAQPVQPADNSSAEEAASTGRPEKRDRLNERFGELTSKIREKDTIIEQLNSQLAQNSALAGIPPLTPDENGEVSVERIQEHSQKVAQALANASSTSTSENIEARYERREVASRIDLEGSTIESLYKDDFDRNPKLAETIRNRVEQEVTLAGNSLQALKQVSALKIANEFMDAVKAERRHSQTQTQQNLETTQAEAGIVPESVPTQVDPNSDAALESRVENIKF